MRDSSVEMSGMKISKEGQRRANSAMNRADGSRQSRRCSGRGQGELAGLRTADLRFTLEKAWAAVMPGPTVRVVSPGQTGALAPGSLRMARVSARSSEVMCGSACWIGARGVGQVRAVRSRSRARSRDRAVSSAGVRGHERHLPYQAAVVLPIAGLAGRDGLAQGRGPNRVERAGCGQTGACGDRGHRDRCCLRLAAIAAHIQDSCRHQEQQTARQRSTCSTASCGGGADIGRAGPCRAGLDAGRCNPACPCLRPARPERRRV